MLEMTPRLLPPTPAVSVAAKERLAKLLATENVTVEHRNVPTAAFDIKNRVLILPNWSDITKDVYDLLVCHEVGHALWTPFEGWHGAVSVKGENYKGFLNVTEDARIEKKIKRKFPGAHRSFVIGYKELIARDFFGIKDRALDSFGLIDRLNLHFKAGALANVPFADDEKVWVDRMGALETFEDAVALADDLFTAAEEAAPETDTGRGEGGAEGEGDPGEAGDGEKGEANPLDNDPDSAEGDAPNTDGDASDESMKGEPGDGENGEADADTEKAEGDDTNSTDSSDGGDDADDNDNDDDEASGDIAEAGDSAGRGDEGVTKGSPFSETDAAFREKEEGLVNTDCNTSPKYVQIPADDAFDLDAIIIDNKTVVRELKASACEPGAYFTKGELDEVVKTQVATYRKKNAKIINYLAKEFDMRKAADASKRTSVAKTGVIDTNSLHSFKWNDDIFKKVASVADGKSHGLQMFVDWSGSMSSNMFGTINQVLNLVLFCKKVGIPFDVYAFTDTYDSRWTRSDDEPMAERLIKGKLVRGDLDLRRDSFNLLQIATSQGNRAAFNDMLIGLIILRGAYNGSRRYAQTIDDSCYYNLDRKYGLGGTPLNEAIMASIPIINRFRKANGLQIVNSVFLTDGAGCDISGSYDDDEYAARGTGSTIIRDRKSRKEFVQRYRYATRNQEGMEQTPILLEMVRIRTGAKICNFYVANPRPSRFKSEWMDSVNPDRDYNQEDTAAAVAAFKIAKVDGGVTIENSIHGWDHHYLIMGGEDLSGTDDEGLDDSLVGATKAKLKSAFGKAATGKLRNRVILRKFVGLIAA